MRIHPSIHSFLPFCSSFKISTWSVLHIYFYIVKYMYIIKSGILCNHLQIQNKKHFYSFIVCLPSLLLDRPTTVWKNNWPDRKWEKRRSQTGIRRRSCGRKKSLYSTHHLLRGQRQHEDCQGRGNSMMHCVMEENGKRKSHMRHAVIKHPEEKSGLIIW